MKSRSLQAANVRSGCTVHPDLRQKMADALPVRIFTACHGTQLLVIQHLRRHLPRPRAREFLVWHPLSNNEIIDRLMRAIVPSAGFDGTLDIREFESLRPRTQGPVLWIFEAVRRLRSDANSFRRWLTANNIDERNVELWTDEPIHFNVTYLRGLLRQARHIKIPHCFNHDDCTCAPWKETLETAWASASWPKKFLFQPWRRWASSVDLRMERVRYDRAYSFAWPSPWSAKNVDISALISIEAFADTYASLPCPLRAEVDVMLAPLRQGSKPIVLLVLFGFNDDPAWHAVYQRAMARIFAERATELHDCTLAVKTHPSAVGDGERGLIEWLKANLPVSVHEIRHPLNLEFMLPQLRPDYVMAGLCGSLPLVRDIGAGRAIMLRELMPPDITAWPGGQRSLKQFLTGIEIW